MKIQPTDYKPYKGFYDLREYEIPKRIFLKLWIIQEYLFKMQSKSEYYKKWLPNQWQSAQEMSADYQQILFSYKQKKR